MNSPSPSLNENSAKKSFWKRSSGKKPGGSVQSPAARSAVFESPQHGPRHKLTFKEFEDHTEDAWDATDDDLLRTALAKIEMGHSPENVQSTAQAVIDNHSRSISTQQQDQVNSQNSSKANSPVTAEPKTFSQTSRKAPGVASRTINENDSDVKTIVGTSFLSDKTKFNEADNSPVENTDKPISTNGNTTQSEANDVALSKIVLAPPSKQNAGSAPKSQSIRMAMNRSNSTREIARIENFRNLINSDSTDLNNLKKLSWSGIPSTVRAVTWQLLSGYLPANKDRRESVLTRKRKEYFKFLDEYYESRETPMYQQTFHQIHIDIPRTNPLIPLFQQSTVQNVFERLLFVWAVRHPASGYVQGINDLVTPFFVVFLSAQIEDEDCDVETYKVEQLPQSVVDDIEADTFWCVSNLLDGIQDNYTFAQPGVQHKVNKLKELTKRVDAELHAHLEAEEIEYLQFSFRWMNNLLMREIPLRCTIRLWDTYLAETDGFSDFHLYVCAAFLKQWRKQLLSESDFQGVMLMIQNVPTHHWGDEEVKLLLAEAFRLKYTFADAPSHLPNKR